MSLDTDTASNTQGLDEDIRILRLPEVQKKTGMSRSAIYSRIRDHQFPEPILIGPRTVGFVEHEVNGWIKRLVSSNRAAVSVI